VGWDDGKKKRQKVLRPYCTAPASFVMTDKFIEYFPKHMDTPKSELELELI
jgi:hypothetical protein